MKKARQKANGRSESKKRAARRKTATISAPGTMEKT
jgi:hypothetical protein